MSEEILSAHSIELGKPLRCEYLVIGSGAGGSVAARELANAGHDVLVIEEGGHHQTDSFQAPISKLTQKLYRYGGVQPFLGKPPVAFGEGCCVGGTTVINGGLLWRTPEHVLDEWVSGHGLSGYGKDDLNCHFEMIEEVLGVQNHIARPGSNRDSEILELGCAELGWKVVPVPRAIRGCVDTNQCPAGCPTGGKQSMLVTYLPQALAAGARILSGLRVTKLEHDGKRVRAVHANVIGGAADATLCILPDHVVVAAGAIQTAFLLRRNSTHPYAGNKLEFHLNLRFAAIFPDSLHAEQGTIFTAQVQEFEKEGLLIMGSNYRQPYVASSLAHFDNKTIVRFMENYDRGGLFVAQVRAKSQARIHANLGSQPMVTYKLESSDVEMIRSALVKTARLLFTAGAEEIFLPVRGSSPIRSLFEAEEIARNLKPDQLLLISVHAMGSCPMGGDTDGSVVDLDGKVRGFDNLFVCDASVLPTNVGESPQGTIMAFAHEIMRRVLEKDRI